MKGFIEVTSINDSKIKHGFQLKNLSRWCNNRVYIDSESGTVEINIKESYEEIKQLIKNAQ